MRDLARQRVTAMTGRIVPALHHLRRIAKSHGDVFVHRAVAEARPLDPLRDVGPVRTAMRHEPAARHVAGMRLSRRHQQGVGLDRMNPMGRALRIQCLIDIAIGAGKGRRHRCERQCKNHQKCADHDPSLAAVDVNAFCASALW